MDHVLTLVTGGVEVGVGAKVVQGLAGAAAPVPAAAFWTPFPGPAGWAGLHPAAASDAQGRDAVAVLGADGRVALSRETAGLGSFGSWFLAG